MNRKLLAALLLAVAPSICLAAYVPPLGIPAPPFGIDQVAPNTATKCPQWPTGATTDCYYVDSTHGSATDTANTYGYPNKPRASIPEVTYNAGAYVEVHGGPYTGGGQIIFTCNGASDNICWIRGVPGVFPTITGETIPKGAYIIMENLAFSTNTGILGFRVHSGSSLHHAAIRNSTFTGSGVAAGNNSAISMFGALGNRFHNLVVDNVIIHNYGNSDPASAENDFHGIGPSINVDNAWILRSTIYNMGGDGVQVGTASTADENRVNRVYIGSNTSYSNRENAVDIKESDNVIVSSNNGYGFTTTSTSAGEGIVIHDTAKDVWIFNNIVHDSVTGIISTGSTNTYFFGNVIYNMSGSGIDYRGGGVLGVYNNTIDNCVKGIRGDSAVVAKNNIISNSSSYHYEIATSGLRASSAFDYSIIYDNTGRINWGDGVSRTVADFKATFSGQGAGDQESNPLFGNQIAHDYTIPVSSPAADNGTTPTPYQTFYDLYGISIQTDIAGTSRPQSPVWDIGAYEYNSNQPAPDNTAPTVPTNLSASGTSYTTMGLTWTASSDAVGVTGYRILRDGSEVNTSTTTSFTDSGLTVNMTYSYTVQAYDAMSNYSSATAASLGTTWAYPVNRGSGTGSWR